MKIVIIPAGNRNTASTRIRALALGDAIRRRGRTVSINRSRIGLIVRVWWDRAQEMLGRNSKKTILFVQKRINSQVLVLAKSVKKNGGLVVYDIDDSATALEWLGSTAEQFREMFHLADVVTTDTAGRKKFLQKSTGHTGIFLLPDSIDYCPEKAAIPRNSNAKLRILWYGGISNFLLIEPHLEAILSTGHELVVCSHQSLFSRLRESFPTVQFIPWSLQTFPDIMRGCQLAVLPHDGDEIDRLKSNNKMIAAIASGVVPLVSNTPEYRKTAEEIGAHESVYFDSASLVRAIYFYGSHLKRMEYLTKAQPIVFHRYHPDEVASEFLKICGKAHAALN